VTRPAQRRFRISIEAAEPIYSGEALCSRCGLTFAVVVVTDEPNPLMEGLSVICKCGFVEPVVVPDAPPELDG
jgi:hypothetical protein